MIVDLGNFFKNYFELGLCPLPLLSLGKKKYILTYTKKNFICRRWIQYVTRITCSTNHSFSYFSLFIAFEG